MNKEQRWTTAAMERDSWMCQNCGTTKHLTWSRASVK
jgi:hypothetical protein